MSLLLFVENTSNKTYINKSLNQDGIKEKGFFMLCVVFTCKGSKIMKFYKKISFNNKSNVSTLDIRFKALSAKK